MSWSAMYMASENVLKINIWMKTVLKGIICSIILTEALFSYSMPYIYTVIWEGK